MDLLRLRNFSPRITRYGLSIVFIIFGLWQFINPSSWLGYLPPWSSSLPFSPTTLIHLNGALDLTLGILLLNGLFTRIIALIAAIHLIGITLSVGWNDVAVRDLGLSIIAIAIAFYGADDWCLDKKLPSFFLTK